MEGKQCCYTVNFLVCVELVSLMLYTISFQKVFKTINRVDARKSSGIPEMMSCL